jgi:hypothetical protein
MRTSAREVKPVALVGYSEIEPQRAIFPGMAKRKREYGWEVIRLPRHPRDLSERYVHRTKKPHARLQSSNADRPWGDHPNACTCGEPGMPCLISHEPAEGERPRMLRASMPMIDRNKGPIN